MSPSPDADLERLAVLAVDAVVAASSGVHPSSPVASSDTGDPVARRVGDVVASIADARRPSDER